MVSLQGTGLLFAAPDNPAAPVLRAVLRLQGFRQLFVALFVMPEERKVSHWLRWYLICPCLCLPL